MPEFSIGKCSRCCYVPYTSATLFFEPFTARYKIYGLRDTSTPDIYHTLGMCPIAVESIGTPGLKIRIKDKNDVEEIIDVPCERNEFLYDTARCLFQTEQGNWTYDVFNKYVSEIDVMNLVEVLNVGLSTDLLKAQNTSITLPYKHANILIQYNLQGGHGIMTSSSYPPPLNHLGVTQTIWDTTYVDVTYDRLLRGTSNTYKLQISNYVR